MPSTHILHTCLSGPSLLPHLLLPFMGVFLNLVNPARPSNTPGLELHLDALPLDGTRSFWRTKRLVHKRSQAVAGLNVTWPDRKVVAMEGDLILGGLMMVHERHNDVVCGPIMPQGGVQALEAMLYTLDFISDQVDFIPGVRLGAHILDDYDKDTYGLEQAVDFIKGSISNIDDGEYKCRDGSSPEVHYKVISGVVGAASSVTSIQVANLLRLFKIPQLRITTTSVTVSLSATVALVCLFTPKLYIILLHPERNVRQSMRTKNSTVRSSISSSSQRVDSGTQSEVFPLDYELHEKLRTMSGGQPRPTSSTQNCPASCPLPEH